MPRPKPLPTPSGSTDLVAAHSESTEMENSFSLPPAAERATPPPSPQQKPTTAPRHKRTSSGAVKKTDEDQFDLPPPPSRARKIIQMKPKSNSSSDEYAPTAPKPASTKRKQPSNTSAAGRKIARKTAHSIIERRRRSKMNEEFGVLKDMIPACEGVEMHKLAILQAGIEYVRYLEGCITHLRGREDEERESPPKRAATASTTDWEYRKASIAASSSSGNPSPDIVPQRTQSHTRLPRISSFTTSSPSATPTPTLLSPAFNAIRFSPDLSRTATSSTATGLSISNPSPNILPLPAAMMAGRMENKSPMSEGGAEATATAALMMMGNDRRGTMEGGRGKGMSVKDLLTS